MEVPLPLRQANWFWHPQPSDLVIYEREQETFIKLDITFDGWPDQVLKGASYVSGQTGV